MKILKGIEWFIDKLKGLERWVKTTSAFVKSVNHFKEQCEDIWKPKEVSEIPEQIEENNSASGEKLEDNDSK